MPTTWRSQSFRTLAAALVLSLVACQTPTDAPAPVRLSPRAAQLAVVPARGSATSLDIANWNIEWFGDANNGPTNESLQLANVRDVMSGVDADIWGVEEVVSTSQWSSLLSQLPGYAGVLSSDAVVSGGSASYSATEQKVAVVYKTSMASLLSARIILTANDYDFAGRPPLEVKLRVTLNGATEDLVVIVLHMKAFNDATSWTRRQNAATALKTYLDTTYPTQKVLVIGDWNDDVDTSITPSKPTPFANFVGDTQRYNYPTAALTAAHVASTVTYPDFIDHQLLSNEMLADYISGSAEAFRADSYITNYGTTTTDHLPIISHFTIGATGGTTPTITVTAPNGGETLISGNTTTITWTSANVANVKIDYTSDGGTNWMPVTSSTSAAAGSFTWAVPSVSTTSAKVRVTDLASTTTDASNAAFSIAPSSGTAQVIINEIMANEPGSNTAGEYVELVNVGSAAASIGGWTLSDGTAVRHTFAAGTSLGAGKAIVVFAGASAIPAGLTNAVAASTGTLNLANAGDQVIVKNGATIVNSFTYTSALAGTDGVSMNRSPDATATGTFVLHTTISSLKASPGTRVNGSAF